MPTVEAIISTVQAIKVRILTIPLGWWPFFILFYQLVLTTKVYLIDLTRPILKSFKMIFAHGSGGYSNFPKEGKEHENIRV